MSVVPVYPVQGLPLDSLPAAEQTLSQPGQMLQFRPAGDTDFSRLLSGGIDGVNTKLVEADAMVRAFALDDSIPVHQVTFALEQARLSFELMLQVRNRLLEGYQQLMNMQL